MDLLYYILEEHTTARNTKTEVMKILLSLFKLASLNYMLPMQKVMSKYSHALAQTYGY